MRARNAPTPSRLLWSRWLVLALLSLLLPLQGALAATMGIDMALMPMSSTGAMGAQTSAMPPDCAEAASPHRHHAMPTMPPVSHASHVASISHDEAMTVGDAPLDHAAMPHGDHAEDAAHADHAVHGDHAMASPTSDSPLPATDGGCHAAGAHASADHPCGICLQCCVGAALPMTAPPLADQALRDVAPTLRAVDVIEPLPRSLDRPPKPVLA